MHFAFIFQDIVFACYRWEYINPQRWVMDLSVIYSYEIYDLLNIIFTYMPCLAKTFKKIKLYNSQKVIKYKFWIIGPVKLLQENCKCFLSFDNTTTLFALWASR